MYKTGTRVIYNQLGELVAIMGDVSSETHKIERPDTSKLYCLDLPYGEIGNERYLIGVDVLTKQPKYKYHEKVEPSPIEKENMKLKEDLILMGLENELGGMI